ncbi:MAG: hypothetical protein JJU11_11795, partial [Candidatus Sumerlaeia bacterium]|nr:hypothetical protein [Candidatus Sumerlaeia bacterium]
LATLDLSTTDFTITMGPEITGIDEAETVTSMAFDPFFESMVISTFAPPAVVRYYDLDPLNGEAFLLSTFEASDGLLPFNIGFNDDGQGYATGATSAEFTSLLFEIDVDLGTLQIVGTTGPDSNTRLGGQLFDWDSTNSLLRAIYRWNDEEGDGTPQHYGTFDTQTGFFTIIREYDNSVFFTGMAVRASATQTTINDWMIIH